LLLALTVAALTGIAMAEEFKYPASGSNSIWYDLKTGTVVGPVQKSAIRNAKIPSEVNNVEIKKIADNAFEGCGQLTSVEIGDKVTEIGENAFINCV